MSKKKQRKMMTTPKQNVSQTQLDQSYIVVKKILRHFDMDTQLIDMFSKKQKQTLLKSAFEIPCIRSEKENTIPRQFVEKIRTETLNHMRTEYFGNPENQLTFMELATYGMGFLISLLYQSKQGYYRGTPQEKIADQINEKFNNDDFLQKGFSSVYQFLDYMTSSYSQVNFRFYGFNYDWESLKSKVLGVVAMRMKITLTVRNCESKMFTYNKIERKAFQLLLTENGIIKDSMCSIIKKNKIFPNAKENEYFYVYIQSHVLYRFKERMDMFSPPLRNYFIKYALTLGQSVVSNGKQKLLAMRLYDECPVGYFTFFISGDDIVINTFIPLASETTPEGKKLCELLSLSKGDLNFLEMDKVSFYTKIDFEQIPILKQALIDSNIWQSKLVLDKIVEENMDEGDESPIDKQQTLFVKNFFDKHEKYRTEQEKEFDFDSDIQDEAIEDKSMNECQNIEE